MKRVCVCLLFLVGCGNPAPKPDPAPYVPPEPMVTPLYGNNTERFTAETHGEFYGGYDNHKREIFVITDHKTGREYLVVTGAGATELLQETRTEVHTTTGSDGKPVTTTETVKVKVEE